MTRRYTVSELTPYALVIMMAGFSLTSGFTVGMGSIHNGFGDESHRLLLGLFRLSWNNYHIGLHDWMVSNWPPGYFVLELIIMSFGQSIGISPILFVNFVSIALYVFCVFAVFQITARLSGVQFGALAGVAFGSFPSLLLIHHTFMSEIPSVALMLAAYMVSMHIGQVKPPKTVDYAYAAFSGALVLAATTIRSESIFFGFALFVGLFLFTHYGTAIVYGFLASSYTVVKLAYNFAFLPPEQRFFNLFKTGYLLDTQLIVANFMDKVVNENSAMLLFLSLVVVTAVALCWISCRGGRKRTRLDRKTLNLLVVATLPFLLFWIFMLRGSIGSHARYIIPNLPFVVAAIFVLLAKASVGISQRLRGATMLGLSAVLVLCSISSYLDFHRTAFRFSEFERGLVEFLQETTENRFVMDFMEQRGSPIALYAVTPTTKILSWTYSLGSVPISGIPQELNTVDRRADRVTVRGYIHLRTVKDSYLVLAQGPLWEKIKKLDLDHIPHLKNSFFRHLIDGLGNDRATMKAPFTLGPDLILTKAFENPWFLVYRVKSGYTRELPRLQS